MTAALGSNSIRSWALISYEWCGATGDEFTRSSRACRRSTAPDAGGLRSTNLVISVRHWSGDWYLRSMAASYGGGGMWGGAVRN